MRSSRDRRIRIVVVQLRAISERFRDSFFFVPALYVLAAIALAELLHLVDASAVSASLPPFLRTTADSARSILSTIAGAIVTVSGIVFSLTVVVLQLASSQYSPRVLHTLLRDRLHRIVMGFVAGTFAYCLVVLWLIHAPAPGQSEVPIPGLSVALAVVLAIGAVLAILAYVDDTAHLMQVVELARRIVDETSIVIGHLPASTPGVPEPERRRAEGIDTQPAGSAVTVRASQRGWVQQADTDALLASIPRGTTLRLDVRIGQFVHEYTPICTIWPPPRDGGVTERLARRAIHVGRTRTTQQDIAFGLRQLVDIALQALSPAVNAPTTAYQVIVSLGALLRELLVRELPPVVVEGDEKRRLLRPHEMAYEDYVREAFEQIRTVGAQHPSIVVTLLETLGALASELEEAGFGNRVAPLRAEAALIRTAGLVNAPLPEDAETIRSAALKAGFGEAETRAAR